MAKPDLIRHINQARVLRLLKEQGTLSRAELSRFLNLNRSTLTYVTGGVLKKRALTKIGKPFLRQAPRPPRPRFKAKSLGALFSLEWGRHKQEHPRPIKALG